MVTQVLLVHYANTGVMGSRMVLPLACINYMAHLHKYNGMNLCVVCLYYRRNVTMSTHIDDPNFHDVN